jgi:ATP-dependent Clp protease ATP-binding subunit ClpC
MSDQASEGGSSDELMFDLTLAAREGKLEPVVGRDAELDRIMRTLSRRRRRQLLLVGESEVGKTSLLHALAQTISDERGVPAHLAGRSVTLLDIGVLGRLIQAADGGPDAALEELFGDMDDVAIEAMRLNRDWAEQEPMPIFCIDRVEALSDFARGRESEIDLVLWILTQLDLPAVMTTRPDEALTRTLADFPAIERIDRMTVVELPLAESVEAARTAIAPLEQHHAVTIADEAADAAVALADRYLTDRPLPAKALDLLDDACALVALHLARKPQELADLETEIAHAQQALTDAVAAEQFEEASLLRRRITTLELRQVTVADAWRTGELHGRAIVNAQAVLAATADLTGIPVDELEYESPEPARTGDGIYGPAPTEPRLPIRSASTALLIVNGHYEDPFIEDNPAAGNNLEDLHACLAHPAHGTTIADAARDTTDTLLVYYSGHGFVADDGRFYLGMRETSHDKWKHTGMPYDQLRSAVIDSPAANKLIVLDCCYSGQAIEMLADANGLGGQLDVEGTYVLTASSATRLAHAPEGHRNSAFTAELIDILAKGLDNGSEVIRVAELYPRLRSSLAAKGFSDPQQRGTNNIGQLAIVKNPFGKDRERA